VGEEVVSLSPEDQSLLDESDAPVAVEGFTRRRVELVARAAKQWASQLVDLGGRNNLLNYRDLRLGTLELTNAAPRAAAALLQSKAVRVSPLFPDEGDHAQVLRRLRTIHNGELADAGDLWQDDMGRFSKETFMGKKDTLRGPPEACGSTPQEQVPADVVSVAMGEAAASARHDAPQDWALLDRVLDGSPVGIVVLDRDLRLLRVNTRAAEMFGVDEAKHGGELLADVLTEMFAEIKTILVDIIAGGTPHVGIETSAPKIGVETESRSYLAYYYPLVAEGSVIGVGCMFFDVTDQRVAEAALIDSEAERRAILGHMLRVEESERSRLALELHDDTIQVLCALLLQFDGMIPLAERTGQDEMAARLRTSRQVLSTATERARRLMFQLHPNVLPERGLRAAITALAEEVGNDIGAQWSVDVPDGRYTWTLEELSYRVVREALTNVRKHSHAHTFSIEIAEQEGRLAGVVQDDGRGLALTERNVVPVLANHLGINGMKERARLAGGDVRVESTLGHGVRVNFGFPLGEPQ